MNFFLLKIYYTKQKEAFLIYIYDTVLSSEIYLIT